MHTDEYEISLNREINHCRAVVKAISKILERQVRHYGLEYAQVVQAKAEGRLAVPDDELAEWRENIEALPVWEQRLQEYREALAIMRVSASRF